MKIRKYLAVGVVLLLGASVFGTVTEVGVGFEEENDVEDTSLSVGSFAEDDPIEIED
ncbi:MAG: hypothetical protein KGY66_06925 [Candidatus Thermoplasmatota archaeon]|nr:hypothetical protein [Candidatus Thermoplasmatota archaeon]MBS3790633.1 hypothetical protein [Candidatus Thermoplasmatota archaeon]